MKVILLAPTPPPAGGIAGWTVRMMQSELKNGWSVEVVDEKAIGSRQVFGKAGRVNLWEEFKRSRGIWKGLKQALKDPEAKVVHSCIPSTTFAMLREYLCAGITHRRGRKFIMHFRCTVPNTTKGRAGRMMLKALCHRCDMIFSLNEQTSRYLNTLTKTPTRLIPNFIRSEELTENHEIGEKLRNAVYIGGIVKNKGIPDLLTLAEKRPDISFRLVGKGDASFEEEAKKKGLTNVVFTGPKDREGVKEELRRADVFLFMTSFRGEGFSNALCEAMAAGVPCIATDWAANRDMLENKGGVVVPVGGVAEAEKALADMESAETRKTMSEWNIGKVKASYLESVVLGQYVDAYEELSLN